jgi:hypothetical protein
MSTNIVKNACVTRVVTNNDQWQSEQINRPNPTKRKVMAITDTSPCGSQHRLTLDSRPLSTGIALARQAGRMLNRLIDCRTLFS